MEGKAGKVKSMSVRITKDDSKLIEPKPVPARVINLVPIQKGNHSKHTVPLILPSNLSAKVSAKLISPKGKSVLEVSAVKESPKLKPKEIRKGKEDRQSSANKSIKVKGKAKENAKEKSPKRQSSLASSQVKSSLKGIIKNGPSKRKVTAIGNPSARGKGSSLLISADLKKNKSVLKNDSRVSIKSKKSVGKKDKSKRSPSPARPLANKSVLSRKSAKQEISRSLSLSKKKKQTKKSPGKNKLQNSLVKSIKSVSSRKKGQKAKGKKQQRDSSIKSIGKKAAKKGDKSLRDSSIKSIGKKAAKKGEKSQNSKKKLEKPKKSAEKLNKSIGKQSIKNKNQEKDRGKDKGKKPLRVVGKPRDKSIGSINAESPTQKGQKVVHQLQRRKSSISEDKHNRKSPNKKLERKDSISSLGSDKGRKAPNNKRSLLEKKRSSSSPDSFNLPKLSEEVKIVKPEKDVLLIQLLDPTKGEDLLAVCEMIMGDHDSNYIGHVFPELPQSVRGQSKGVINHSFIKSDFSAERQAYVLTPKKLLEILGKLPKVAVLPKGMEVSNVKLVLQTKSKMRMLAGLLQYSVQGKELTVHRFMVAKMFRRAGYMPFALLFGVREVAQRSKAERVVVLLQEGLGREIEVVRGLGMKSQKPGVYYLGREELSKSIARRLK